MITLQNKGVLDIDFIKLMGVNVKESDSAIGRFGTGLKYAIAVFIREGVDFEIYLGENLFTFSKEDKNLRGKSFELCIMNGPMDRIELPFTTELGKDWDLWMAYRELYTNCVLDEDGEKFEGMFKDRPRQKGSYTTINILSDIYTENIFVRDMGLDLLFTNDNIEIYEGNSEYLYYQGIRAKELAQNSRFTYNIKSGCTLSEDRQVSNMHEAGLILANSFIKMGDRKLLERILENDEDYYENHINYTGVYLTPSEDFKCVVSDGDRGFYINYYIESITPKEPEKLTKEDIVGKIKDAMQDLRSDTEDAFYYDFDEDNLVIKIGLNIEDE